MKKSLLFAFSVFCGLTLAEPVWSVSSQSGAFPMTSLAGGNIMRAAGSYFTEFNNSGAWSHSGNCNLTKLNDGVFSSVGGEIVTVGDNATLELHFPGAANVSAVRIFTVSQGRCGIGVKNVYCGTKGTYTVISSAAYSEMPTDKQHKRYTFANDDGSVFASGCDSIKIEFGTMHNNGTIVGEIEVSGEITSSESYTVRFFDKDGVQIGADQTVESGNDAVPPTPPEVSGHTFTGWIPGYEAIIADTDCRATYLDNNTPVWTNSVWNGSASTPAEDNLLLTSGAGVIDVTAYSCWNNPGSLGTLSTVVDGSIGGGIGNRAYGIAKNSQIELKLPGVSNVRAVRLYSYVNGGLDINLVTISSVEAEFDGVFTDIGAVGYSARPASTDVQFYELSNLEGADIAEGVTALRLNFGNVAPNNTFICYEIEVVGEVVQTVSYEVKFYDKDGNQVGATQNVDAGCAAAAPVLPEVPGYTFVGWDADFASVASNLDIHPVYRPVDKPHWQVALRAAGDTSLPPDNIMTKPDCAVIPINNSGHGWSDRDDPSILNNGVIEDTGFYAFYTFANNSSVKLSFAKRTDVREIRIYMGEISGTREGLEILSVTFAKDTGAEITLDCDAYSLYPDDTANAGRYYYTLFRDDGGWLAENVDSATIAFGSMHHSSSVLREIAVCGKGTSGSTAVLIK